MAFIASLLGHLAALRARRRHRCIEHSLRALPDYLLKDVGLRFEAGELRAVASENLDAPAPAAPKLTLIQGAARGDAPLFHVKRQRQGAAPVCRHCGAPLP